MLTSLLNQEIWREDMDIWVNKAMQSDFLNVGHKFQYCYNN